jgi:hypothetical protein
MHDGARNNVNICPFGVPVEQPDVKLASKQNSAEKYYNKVFDARQMLELYLRHNSSLTHWYLLGPFGALY